MVILKTNYGDITLELDAEKAPGTVANFIQYVKDGFYDGTLFHRVIDDFMIQGGGLDGNMQPKATRDTIPNEADNGLKNDALTVAMARTNAPHSATAQFFINVKDNAFLNHRSKNQEAWGYTVFGKVNAGTDVINKIKKVKTTTRNGHQDVPVEAIIIDKVVWVEGEEQA